MRECMAMAAYHVMGGYCSSLLTHGLESDDGLGDEPSFDQIGRTIANSSFSRFRYLSERAKGLLRLNHD